ncbi:hypothetical protein, partial [Parabacteroides distasonis]|uniref:hypothetical protein n=1 Tax=Parabacteroides distasonis TaxID=823 RepID=UPI001D083770
AQSILGPEGAAVVGTALRDAERYGQTVNAIAFASPDELNAITSALSLKLESPENFEANAAEATRIDDLSDPS